MNHKEELRLFRKIENLTIENEKLRERLLGPALSDYEISQKACAAYPFPEWSGSWGIVQLRQAWKSGYLAATDSEGNER